MITLAPLYGKETGYAHMKLPRARCAIPLAAVLALAAASEADASGGSSIASAPVVTYGQQEFGNTLDSPAVPGCDDGFDDPSKRRSWWSLPVSTGDKVTIDWESQVRPVLELWPAGTTDFTFGDEDPVIRDTLNDNNQRETKFVARQAGSMPMLFVTDTECIIDSSDHGPYDFTAYVAHGLSLALARVKSLKHSGTIVASVHTPDGGPVSDPALIVAVQMKRHSHWKTIGTAPAINSAATVHTHVSKRVRTKRITIRARAQGAGYVTKVSAARRVRLR